MHTNKYEIILAKLFEQIKSNALTDITIDEYCNRYLAWVKRNRSPKTFSGAEIICKKLLRYFSPIQPLKSISVMEAEKLLEAQKKNAPKGVYNYRKDLRAMFNKAIEWNLLFENAFEKAELPIMQEQSKPPVTAEDKDKISRHTDNAMLKDVIEFGFNTGLRLGEITALTWGDVSLKEKKMTIGNKDFKTKSRRIRVVPINVKVEEILQQRLPKILKQNHHVFGKTNGKPFSTDCFSRNFKRACRKAGVDEAITFHCLRHGAITKMILAGAPLPAVQRIAGHQQIQTTMRYTHPNIEDLRKAVNLI